MRSMGLVPSTAGAATISAEVDLGRFEEIFGVTATRTESQPATNYDFGKSAGYTSPNLKIPEALSDFVESISAAAGLSYL
jgi:hypothetical protein